MELHRHVLQYLTDSELLHRIGEFQSFDFQADGAGQILLAVLFTVPAACYRWPARSLAHFLLAARCWRAAFGPRAGCPWWR